MTLGGEWFWRKREASHEASFLLAFLLVLPTAALADSSALILRGVAGSPEHEQKFEKWTAGTSKALVDKFGFSQDRVIVLTDKKTVQAEIQKAFATLKQQLKPGDTFFLFFIGHGSADDGTYKFISGPDYTADEYNKLLATLNAGRIVRSLPAYASGFRWRSSQVRIAWLLRRPATGKKTAISFSASYFLEALQNPAADEDKDQKGIGLGSVPSTRWPAPSASIKKKDGSRRSTRKFRITAGAPTKPT